MLPHAPFAHRYTDGRIPVPGFFRIQSAVPEHHGTAHGEPDRNDPDVPQGPRPGHRGGQIQHLAVAHRGAPAGPSVAPERERDHGRTLENTRAARRTAGRSTEPVNPCATTIAGAAATAPPGPATGARLAGTRGDPGRR
ncbi:hypothetical protein SMICM304S_11178 [Streptomyces microflavus]